MSASRRMDQRHTPGQRRKKRPVGFGQYARASLRFFQVMNFGSTG